MYLALLLAASTTPTTCEAPVPVRVAEVGRVIGRPPARNERVLMAVEEVEGENAQLRVFVRGRSGWSRHTVGDSQEIVTSYITPAKRRIVFGFHLAEGPGEEFYGLVLDGNGRALACPVLDFASLVNRDERTGERSYNEEFLKFDSLTIARRGAGKLQASGTIDVNGSQRKVRYDYVTADGGITWSAARSTNQVRAASRRRR